MPSPLFINSAAYLSCSYELSVCRLCVWMLTQLNRGGGDMTASPRKTVAAHIDF